MHGCNSKDDCAGVIAETDHYPSVDNCEDARVHKLCLGGIYSSYSLELNSMQYPLKDCLYEKIVPNGKE